MRTTVELPDDLLRRARKKAAAEGVSLKEFFIAAIQERLAPRQVKVRRPPPVIGRPDAKPIKDLTAEQRDDAMFG